MAFGDLPPIEKEEEDEPQAPLWMVTMSDMNTLLMTFFVILFSFLVIERNKYLRLSDQPQPTGLPDRSPERGIIKAEPNDSKIFSGWEPGRSKSPAKLSIDHANDRVEVKIVSKAPSPVSSSGIRP